MYEVTTKVAKAIEILKALDNEDALLQAIELLQQALDKLCEDKKS